MELSIFLIKKDASALTAGSNVLNGGWTLIIFVILKNQAGSFPIFCHIWNSPIEL